jgi:hypothetical protein
LKLRQLGANIQRVTDDTIEPDESVAASKQLSSQEV